MSAMGRHQPGPSGWFPDIQVEVLTVEFPQARTFRSGVSPVQKGSAAYHRVTQPATVSNYCDSHSLAQRTRMAEWLVAWPSVPG